MTNIEKKLIGIVRKYAPLIIFVIATLAGMLIRMAGMDFRSDDYNSFLSGWWNVIADQDFSGLSQQVGNYNIYYMDRVTFNKKYQFLGGTNMNHVIVNRSFEYGNTTGWTTVNSADTGVKDNVDPYTTSGIDGSKLFNTWWEGKPLTQESLSVTARLNFFMMTSGLSSRCTQPLTFSSDLLILLSGF